MIPVFAQPILNAELTGAGERSYSARSTAVIPTGHERESG